MSTTVELEENTTLNLQFQKRAGLLPAAVQETTTGQILLLASVNQQAFKYSIKHKIAAFYSTSRNSVWIKGESSGNFLQLDKVLVDCDQDALVYKVALKKGGVCNTFNQFGENRKACFYRALDIESQTIKFLEK